MVRRLGSVSFFNYFTPFQFLTLYCVPFSLLFSGPFNFQPGVAENKRCCKSLAFFFGGRKLKGPKFFRNPSITVKTKRKNVIYRRWPKIKGAELGEGGRKLEGMKIKGAEN